MRISSNPNDDIGYKQYCQMLTDLGTTIEIYLDGVRQDHVVTADEELGMIIRYVQDSGNFVLLSSGEVDTETLSGKVEIRVKQRATELNTPHIMIDIETLGIAPGSHILSVGWARFNEDQVVDHGEFKMGPANGNIDLDTVRWWMLQNREAQDRSFGSSSGMMVKDMLTQLTEIIGNRLVWSNGPSFDQAFLDNLSRRYNMPSVCSHRNVRCYRTLTGTATLFDPTFDARERAEAISKDLSAQGLTPHTAEGDAITQARVVIEAMKVLLARVKEPV
jgi:hypothetical protein